MDYTNPVYYLFELDKPEELAKWNALFGPDSQPEVAEQEETVSTVRCSQGHVNLSCWSCCDQCGEQL